MLVLKLEEMVFTELQWHRQNLMKTLKKKTTVQVGDPFAEKLLLEACLELMKDNSIISIQDMGAAGLTSSSVEMASKGKLGIELNLNKVPCRENNMTPYEMMLSESQERMLIILDDKKEEEARRIFDKWDLDFVVIGKTTNTNRLILNFDDKKVADIPIPALSDKAPLYERKWTKSKLSKNKVKIKDLKKLKLKMLLLKYCLHQITQTKVGLQINTTKSSCVILYKNLVETLPL